MLIGIIDIGSNSIRLAIYEIIGKSYKVLNQLKYSARLATNMQDGLLDEERIESALNTLKYFKEYTLFNNIDEIIAVATEAVRKAVNQNAFISEAEKILGTKVRVITGLEEAYFDYLATVNTMDINDALVFDLGGASTELILIKDRKLEESISIPFGGINLTENYMKGERVRLNNLFEDMNEYLSGIKWLNNLRGINVIGIGGSSRTIGKIDRYMKNQSTFIAHNYSVSKNDLNRIHKVTKDYLMDSGKKVPGLNRDREDIFLASLSFVKVLSDKVKSRRIFVSGSGLREGILFEYLYGGNKLVPNVLEFSLNNIINQHMSEIYKGPYVWTMVEKIFTYLFKKDINMMQNKKSLKVATYLYDLGNNINYFQKDRNTFYSILNAPINGLNQKQILIAASIATLYNSDDILKDYLNKKILNRNNILEIEKSGLILKLGVAICYGLNNDIRITDIKKTENLLEISVASKIELLFLNDELSYLQQHFMRVFGFNVKVKTQVITN